MFKGPRWVWITKYSLTKGIFKAEVLQHLNLHGILYQCGRYAEPEVASEGEWFLTKDEAIRKANERREHAISCHLEQVERLRAMKFE